jgi:ubiquinone/menaquinone biosynthesis C-methylase UbiE
MTSSSPSSLHESLVTESVVPLNDPQENFSETFYRTHGRRYAEINDENRQYVWTSDERFRRDADLLEDFMRLLKKDAKGASPSTFSTSSGQPLRGLDAGCGAGARDLDVLCGKRFNAYGLDAVPENIRLSCQRKPHLTHRLLLHDLRDGLCFTDASFDFILCGYVIQHNEPKDVFGVILPELVRVLRPHGAFRIIFKYGKGIRTVFDPGYQRTRTFHLYDEKEVLDCLETCGMRMEQGYRTVRFTDYKLTDHVVFHMRKGLV